MLIRDIMTKEVISVSPDTSVKSVANLIIEKRIHGVPVVEGGKPVGMITETDFFTKGSNRVYLPEYVEFLERDVSLGNISPAKKEKLAPLLNVTAKDIMSQPCIFIGEKSNVADFFSLVQNNNLTSVPVVDSNGSLAGIVTLIDVIRAMNFKE